MEDSDIDRHVVDYEKMLIALRDDLIDPSRVASDKPINASLDEAFREAENAR
jgi:hypothetical protein